MKAHNDLAIFRGVQQVWAGPRKAVSPAIMAEARDRALIKQIREDRSLHADYVRRFQAGEPGIERILIRVNYPFLLKTARRLGRAYKADFLDWLQAATLGLLEGYARFDLTTQNSPSTYVWQYAKGYAARNVASTGAVVRIPIHQFDRKVKSQYRRGVRYCWTFTEMDDRMDAWMEHSFEETLTDDGPLPDEVLADEEVENAIPIIASYLMTELGDKYRDILTERFFRGRTLVDVGAERGYSRERARQIESLAITLLQQRVRAISADPDKYESFEGWLAALTRKIQEQLEAPVDPVTSSRKKTLTFPDEPSFANAIREHVDRHDRLRIVFQNRLASSVTLRALIKKVTGVRPVRIGPTKLPYKVLLKCPVCETHFAYDTTINVSVANAS